MTRGFVGFGRDCPQGLVGLHSLEPVIDYIVNGNTDVASVVVKGQFVVDQPVFILGVALDEVFPVRSTLLVEVGAGPTVFKAVGNGETGVNGEVESVPRKTHLLVNNHINDEVCPTVGLRSSNLFGVRTSPHF